ncbi:hypothetical protein DICPUDRAFT_56832 [Dictyostelium purpureum]|uniref:MOSC domain-containing protein n=1 Tax=Dictyostelium purpureum TaxID=5786 RepID=F0ZT98_DICPU|nr:uncharacterized protein DICPUDRAFT_56832 [Dictyostelium purpureum]EGC32818.1 hypothetical protein DICPUDRAFT_56832 [Dictyostelium purpureum]|eukprot:XP_003290641.1 hypothetical protein DICPUDRAFT_56832 [Dictyostelium purpureum]
MSAFFEWVQANIKYFVGAGILAANLYTFYNYFTGKSNNFQISPPSQQRDHPIRVKEIFIYPIKSCRGISVKSAKIDKLGFELDRRWMIINNGRFITQRQYPKMALIHPSLYKAEDGEEYLVISAEGEKEIRVKVNEDLSNKPTTKVGIWKDSVNVVDCGEEAHQWLTKFLGVDLHLVRVAPGSEYHRRIPEDYVDNIIDNATEEQREQYQFALCDTSQVMMVSESSIDDLNQHIVATRKQNNEQQRDPVTVYNFRPNVLLSSCTPFEEDTWTQVRISGLLLKKVQYTPRCKLTTVDPNKGVLNPFDDDEPLRTLRAYREFDQKLLFGVLFVHEQDQNGYEINVGDIVDVLGSTSDPYPIKK